LKNLELQESFKHIQEQRTISVSVEIISIFGTKFLKLCLPKIFLLQKCLFSQMPHNGKKKLTESNRKQEHKYYGKIKTRIH